MRLFHLFLASFVATPVWASGVFYRNKRLVLAAEENGKWYTLTNSRIVRNGRIESDVAWKPQYMPRRVELDENKCLYGSFEMGVSKDSLVFMDSKTTNDSLYFDNAGKLVKDNVFLCKSSPVFGKVYVKRISNLDCSKVNIYVKLYDSGTRKLYSKTVGDIISSDTSNVAPFKDPKALFVTIDGTNENKPIPITVSYNDYRFHWGSYADVYATEFTWENSQLVANIDGKLKYACLLKETNLGNIIDQPCANPIKIDSNNKIVNRELYKCKYSDEIYFYNLGNCETIDVYVLPYDRETNRLLLEKASPTDISVTGDPQNVPEIKKTPTPGFMTFENGRVAFGETKNPAVFMIDGEGKLEYKFY